MDSPPTTVGTLKTGRKTGTRENLKGAIATIQAARGLTTREVIRGFDSDTVATAYRVLSGSTNDPRVSTLVLLCKALNATVDEVLKAEDALGLFDPESRDVYDQLTRLSEEDQWVAHDLLRSVLARRLHGLRGPKKSQGRAPRKIRASRRVKASR